MQNPAVASNLQSECDELPGASGEFGSATNPIPVNGPGGEVIYINRLRRPKSGGFMFHRTGTVPSPLSPMPLDRFELLALDGSEWRVLYFSMYHPRRSTKCPAGLEVTPWPKDPMTQIMLKIPTFGFMAPMDDFPYDLPNAVRATLGSNSLPQEMANALADAVQRTVDALPKPLNRPPDLDKR